MAAEKKGSKGKFLYMFDWHGKSRKKLFSSKAELSGGSNQGTESLESPEIPFRVRERCFSEDGYLTKERGNYHFGSSITEDDSYETKAPGVVARLMGLDSLPVPTAGETSSVSSRDNVYHGVQSSYYPRNPSGYQHERHPPDFGYKGRRLGDYHSNSVDYRSIVVPGRPFDRFQNEMLPPKSAKPISITHHKLLSPIKSPGFIQANDATYIMEAAAARFTDPALSEISLLRTSSFGSSSTPIKIRDLKDKMEAAHRLAILPESSKKTKRALAAKHLSGNSRDRLADRPSSRTSDLETNGASSSTIKGKAVSSDAYGKDNVRRKDVSSNSIGNRKMMNREHNQVNLKQSSNSQASAKKSEHTRHSANRSSVLVKQSTDNRTSKHSISNKQPRRSIPIDGSSSSSKRVTKTSVNSEGVSKKASNATVLPDKRPALNRMTNISRSKELQIKDRQVKKKTEHDIAPQMVTDTKKAMDVISFTFNSPIKKSASVSHSSSEMGGSSNLLDSESRFTNDEFDSKSSPSPLLRLNLIGCDDLSLLLEQKLKELTNKVELNESLSDSGRQATDVDSVSSCSELASRKNVQADSAGDMESFYEDDPYSVYTEAYRREEIEEGCSSEANTFYREGHHPGHINSSTPKPFFPTGSCILPNNRSGCSSGKAQAFLHQFEEETSCISTESHPIEDERDISDTTSSSYYDEWDTKHTSTSQNTSEVYLSDWELQYVKQIVHISGLKEIVLNEAWEIIHPSVFDHAENLIYNSATNTGECTKLARKLLFDCLNDLLSLKYEHISAGSYKSWCWWRVVLQKEDWLVEELYKEIYSLAEMENLMVDELVEKDMGVQYSGWLAFDIEALEEGMEIEQDIVDLLISEMVEDLCLVL